MAPAAVAGADVEADMLSMTLENNKAQVLDNNARLYFELDPQNGANNLNSFYCEYIDYLEDRYLVDVSIQVF